MASLAGNAAAEAYRRAGYAASDASMAAQARAAAEWANAVANKTVDFAEDARQAGFAVQAGLHGSPWAGGAKLVTTGKDCTTGAGGGGGAGAGAVAPTGAGAKVTGAGLSFASPSTEPLSAHSLMARISASLSRRSFLK